MLFSLLPSSRTVCTIENVLRLVKLHNSTAHYDFAMGTWLPRNQLHFGARKLLHKTKVILLTKPLLEVAVCKSFQIVPSFIDLVRNCVRWVKLFRSTSNAVKLIRFGWLLKNVGKFFSIYFVANNRWNRLRSQFIGNERKTWNIAIDYEPMDCHPKRISTEWNAL